MSTFVQKLFFGFASFHGFSRGMFSSKQRMHCSCLYVFPEARFFRGGEKLTKKLDITSGYLLPCGFCRTQPVLENSLLIGPLALIIQSYCTQTLGKCHNCSCVCLDGDSQTLSPTTVLEFNFSQVKENRWFWFPDQPKPVEVTFSQRNAWFTEQRLVLSALILSEKPCILGEHLVCPSCADKNQRHPCFEVCPGWDMQPILRSLEMKPVTAWTYSQYGPIQDGNWVITVGNPYSGW
jgi:hypothetical protein